MVVSKNKELSNTTQNLKGMQELDYVIWSVGEVIGPII